MRHACMHTDKLGRVTEAQETFESILNPEGPFRPNPIPPAAYFSLGKILYKQGHHAKAIELLHFVRDLDSMADMSI